MADTQVLRRTARAIQVVLLAMFVFFAVSTIPGVRSTPAFIVWLDGWVQGTAYVLIAVLAVLRPVAVRRHRLVWSLVAASVVLRVSAFVWFWVVVRVDPSPPYPSASDAGWILSAVALLVAVGMRAGDFAPLVSRSMLLDAIAGALFVAGVSTAIVYPLLVQLSRPGIPSEAVATNLAYPLLDLALLLAATGLLAMTRWRLRGPEAVLVLGVATFAVVDVTFLYQVTQGTYHPGTWLATLSLVGTGLVASAGWTQGSSEDAIEADQVRAPGLSVPVAVAMLSVAVLAYAGFLRLASVVVAESALVLLVLAVAIAVWRGTLTVTQDRALLGETTVDRDRFQALVEASGDFIAIANMQAEFVYVNPAGRAMIGLEPDESLDGLTIAGTLTEEGRRRLAETSGPTVRAGGRWSGPSMLRHLRGGQPVAVTANTFALKDPEDGRTVAMATIQRDLRDLQRAESALESLAEQRRVLLDRLVEAQEEERAKIAEDVHDDSVQALAAVDLRLGLLRRKLGEDHELAELVEKAHDAVTEATGRLRHLLFDLESPARDQALAGALEAAADFAFEDTPVRWSVTGERDLDLAEATRVTAYRVVKEALVNVRKHARANTVEVHVESIDDGGVLIRVVDDGVGYDEALAEERGSDGHHGLANMRDRVAVAGGRFSIAAQDKGTEVRLWLPDLYS